MRDLKKKIVAPKDLRLLGTDKTRKIKDVIANINNKKDGQNNGY